MAEQKRQDTVRERRFTLELWEMDSKFQHFVNSYAICQLAYFNASFFLNSIPQAVVAPLFGTIINNTTSADGYYSSKFELKDILAFATKRVPVCVVIRVNHSFSSELDNLVVDKQYWKPNIDTSREEYYDSGLYVTDRFIVFKGYILPPTINIAANSAQVRLTLVHWLSNIADVSLLTSFCHTSVPTEFALQTYSTPTDDSSDNTWAIISSDEGAFTEPKALWEDGIRKIFSGALDYYKDAKFYTNYTAERREYIATALDNIEADDTLTFIEDFTDNTNTFNCLVGMALKSENHQNFVNVTAWDKLIRQYSPAFLFSIVPRVSKALLIPTPTIEYLENKEDSDGDEKITIIKNNEILNISSLPLTNLMLNRLVCVPPEPTDVSRTPAGPATYISMSTYPPEEGCEQRSGFVSTITYPSWLGLPVENKIDQPSKQYRPEDNPDKLVKDANERQEELEGIKKIKQTIAEQYTKFAYLTQVYSSTWTNITVPCRMDICPGAMVKCIIDNPSIKYTFYGTVTGVTINMLPGTNTSNTQLTLTNIRVEDLAKDSIENPQDFVGFYTKQWTGKDVPLYDH